MTLIRLTPDNIANSTATAPTDLLCDLMDLHIPLLSQDKAGKNAWSPALDVYDDKDTFVVTLEAPGLKKEDFEISWHDGNLNVAGERKEDKPEEGRSYFRRERFLGRFSRAVALPADVQADKIAATYKDGVLTITLPKAEQAKPKHIEVNVS